MINWEALTVFIFVFGSVAILGFVAARWRAGDLTRLQEWGLAGRRFGTIVSWFLLGGDIYTAYSFIAVPGKVFKDGAIGFFAIPYLIIIYPLVFIILPKFWAVSRHRGYITPSDFVRERFDSGVLALLVAITGILAVMPYIALQIYGIEVVIAQMGVPIEISLFVAFAILAAYTYVSGLRAPAMIALVKDTLIWLVVIVAVIYIPTQLGGFEGIFASVHAKAQTTSGFHDILRPSDYSTYVTLALGSALALFLYPHTLTGILSTNSRKVVRRNAALLPAYTLLIGLIALLGYMAIAANIHPGAYGANEALPDLFSKMFPSWFSGVAFAAIAIGALVPAAIMSIAAANLFTRNIYREYFRPTCTEREEASVAKTASLVVKIGALVFILFLPATLAINFQLLSNIWIIQTLPAVFIGLYTNWFHRRALIIGIMSGLVVGTLMVVVQNFDSVYPLFFGGITIPMYAAIPSLIVNLVLSAVLTPLFRGMGVSAGEDATSPADYEAQPLGVQLPTLTSESTIAVAPVAPTVAQTRPAPSQAIPSLFPTSPPITGPLVSPAPQFLPEQLPFEPQMPFPTIRSSSGAGFQPSPPRLGPQPTRPFVPPSRPGGETQTRSNSPSLVPTERPSG